MQECTTPALAAEASCLLELPMGHTSSLTFGRLLLQPLLSTCTTRMMICPSSEDLQGTRALLRGDIKFLKYASGVPGEVRGLDYLHKHYARLPWTELLQPAIKLARHGFVVDEDLWNFINMPDQEFLTDDPSWAIDFAPNGTLLSLGDIMTRERYADTPESISVKGPDAFYSGAIAERTIAAVSASNGTMTLQDLEKYSVTIGKPVQIEYRGYKLTAGGAPSGGPVALSALKIVGGYPGFGQQRAINLTTHRLDEALRFAYGEVRQTRFPSVP